MTYPHDLEPPPPPVTGIEYGGIQPKASMILPCPYHSPLGVSPPRVAQKTVNGKFRVFVECPHCLARGPQRHYVSAVGWREVEKAAREAWNRRGP